MRVSILHTALVYVTLLGSIAPTQSQELAADRTLAEQRAGTEQGTLGVALGGTVREVSYSATEQGEALYQGDILLGSVKSLEAIAHGIPLMEVGEAIQFGLGARDTRLRWPNGVLRYIVNPNVPIKSRIYTAINAWELSTNIRFEEISQPDGNYVEFVRGDGCSSFVGMVGGRQVINLGDACSTGNTIHEIGHALGLHHEQAREDRGANVIVMTENIQAGREGNFRRDPLNFEDLNPYCHGSIMHYSAYAFSRQPGLLKTIETVPPGIPIGQRSAIAPCDVAAVTTMYSPTQSGVDDVAMGFEGELELFPDGCREDGKCNLRSDVYFTDAWNVRWKVPARDTTWGDEIKSGTTDGASIPVWAQPLIGEPFDKEYLLAAALHDHYCYEENLVRGWRQTHRMFYDAMVTLGVPAFKAKLMYAAVYLGGPKWTELVPGESCGPKCIFDAMTDPDDFAQADGRVWLYRDSLSEADAAEEFERIKGVLKVVPELALADIESIINTMNADDPFYGHGATVVPSGPSDMIFDTQ